MLSNNPHDSHQISELVVYTLPYSPLKWWGRNYGLPPSVMKSALKIFPRSLHRLSFLSGIYCTTATTGEEKPCFMNNLSACLLAWFACWLDCEQLSLSSSWMWHECGSAKVREGFGGDGSRRRGRVRGGVPMSLICKGYGIEEVLKTRWKFC
jgi:hypothetical protein